MPYPTRRTTRRSFLYWLRFTGGQALVVGVYVTVVSLASGGAPLSKVGMQLHEVWAFYIAAALFLALVLWAVAPLVRSRLGASALGFLTVLPIMAFIGAFIYPDPLTPRQFVAGMVLGAGGLPLIP